MEIDIVLYVLAALFMLLGLIGSVAPMLPGAPLCYAGLLLLHATDKVQFSTTFLLLWLAVVIALMIIEYFLPIWSTKKFGGTSSGMWGAAIGFFVGLFLLPGIGAFFGVILGAFIGELSVHGSNIEGAAKSALGAVLGFVLSTALKFFVCAIMVFYFVKELINALA